MTDVSIRDLRNQGGAIVDRAQRGEPITITRAGTPVAVLRPVPDRPLSAERLIERWRALPAIDPGSFRSDIDELLDSDL